MKIELIEKIKTYYDDKLKAHGPTAKGVDWKNEETQVIRFALLSEVFAGQTNFTVNDLGCGYGAFAEYLLAAHVPFDKYHGYDISDEMIYESKKKFAESPSCCFTKSSTPTEADFTVSSGIFNVKLDTPDDEWKVVVEGLLETMHAVSRKGFSFNMLNQPTAESFRREHLFYADSDYFETLCREKFGTKTNVLKHENLYEFTIVVTDLRR
jgi:SAM-dependent methyltransferase